MAFDPTAPPDPTTEADLSAPYNWDTLGQALNGEPAPSPLTPGMPEPVNAVGGIPALPPPIPDGMPNAGPGSPGAPVTVGDVVNPLQVPPPSPGGAAGGDMFAPDGTMIAAPPPPPAAPSPLGPQAVTPQEDQLASGGPPALPVTPPPPAMGPLSPAELEQARQLGMDPNKLAQADVEAQGRARAYMAARQAQVEGENIQRIHDDLAIKQKSVADTDAQMADIDQQVQRIANIKIDPDLHLGVGKSIAGVLMSGLSGALGGLPGGGGKNVVLDNWDKAIQRNIDAQKDNLQNQWEGVKTRKSLVNEQYERHGDLYRAQETARLGLYQAGINQIQTEMQNFDPRGSMVRQLGQSLGQIQAMQLQARQALADKLFKQNIEQGTFDLAKRKQDEEERKDEANEALKAMKLGVGQGQGSGLGAGASASDAKFNIASGYFDPFTQQPIMSRRPLGKAEGKGGDEQEPKDVHDQLAGYANEQQLWAELSRIGARANYHKNLGGALWGKYADTDTREYETVRQQLAAAKAKALGARINPSEIESQAHTIPELNDIVTTHDVGKMLTDSQERSDRLFSSSMNVSGIDGDSVIKNARAMRAPPPEPAPIDAAEAALAAGSGKDADRAREDAQDKLRAEVEKQQQAQLDIHAASGMTPPRPPIDVAKVTTNPDEAAGVELVNRTANTYGERLKQYQEIAQDTSWSKGIKGKGDLAAAQTAHQEKLAKAAHEVVAANKIYEDQIQEVGRKFPAVPARVADTVGKPHHAHVGMGDIPQQVHHDGRDDTDLPIP